MSRTLNLGILAHVDAGKTSLTERLLHTVGVIDEIGSVDDGSTRTDSLALERQRGITIKSAVVSFEIDDITVNLIDTPGHPDFIAEVERVLNVLDGAVLVVSAVEGVQAQTRVLMRALRRLRIPTLIFVNKIDRRGARHEDLLKSVAARLTPAIVPMGEVGELGTPRAHFTPYDPSRPGSSNSSPSTTTVCSPPTSTTGRPSPPPGCARHSPPRPARPWSTRSSTVPRSPARASANSSTASGSCCPRRTQKPTPRYPARSSRSNEARRARRSPTCACSTGRCAPGTG